MEMGGLGQEVLSFYAGVTILSLTRGLKIWREFGGRGQGIGLGHGRNWGKEGVMFFLSLKKNRV